MLTLEDLQNDIRHLLERLKEPILDHKVYLKEDGMFCIYIKYVEPILGRHFKMSVSINKKGEIYNPCCMPYMLTQVFDWLSRVGLYSERSILRNEIIKKELLEASEKMSLVFLKN
jgi:hypothetical protein